MASSVETISDNMVYCFVQNGRWNQFILLEVIRSNYKQLYFDQGMI